MAHLWVHDRDGWAVVRLADAALSLASRRPRPCTAAESGAVDGPLLTQAAELRRWLLLSRRTAAVLVNGIPLATGVRVLEDRDEIRVRGAGTFYFSTERLARVVPFPSAVHPVHCARCKRAILVGAPAVECPACDTWHHQSDEFPCFVYSDVCSLCPQPTALDCGFQWSPEDL